jgi:hypothetical protein
MAAMDVLGHVADITAVSPTTGVRRGRRAREARMVEEAVLDLLAPQDEG